LVNEVIKEELEPLKKQYAILRRNNSRKYHKELRLNDFITENDINDDEFMSEELEKIENEYYDLPEKTQKVANQIENLTQKCQDIMEKRLYDVFIPLDMENQRKIIELVKNKFEIQDKKVKLTFKSAFRKIRKR